MTTKITKYLLTLEYPTATVSVAVEQANSEYEALLKARNLPELRDLELANYPNAPVVVSSKVRVQERRQVGVNAWVITE